jgi:CRISPR-associated endonuclease Csy4
LFVELGPSALGPVAGAFNSYGLSSAATIPWF